MSLQEVSGPHILHVDTNLTVLPACAQVCAAMCTILAAVLARVPDAVLLSKFAPSAAILSALAERHADQVRSHGLPPECNIKS